MDLQQQMDNPFADATTLDAEITAAIEWQAARSPEEVMRTREQMTIQLERAGRAQWDAGQCVHFAPGIKDVCLMQAWCSGGTTNVMSTFEGWRAMPMANSSLSFCEPLVIAMRAASNYFGKAQT